MNEITELFFELLRISVCSAAGVQTDKCTMALSRVPSCKEWSEMYDLATKHSIVGVTMGGIERLPKHQLPTSNLLLNWFGQTEILSKQNELLDQRACELTEAFDSMGLPSCVLKGQGVASLYPNPRRRSGGDIDLWVAGGRRKVLDAVRRNWEVGDVLMYHVDAKVFKDVMVEVHYVPAFSYNPLRYRKYLKYFGKEEKVQMNARDSKIGFASPTPEFQATYSMIHVFNHVLNNEVRLKQVVDYYYILQKLSAHERQKVMKTLKWIGLERFAEAMMWVMQMIFIDTRKDLEESGGAEWLLCKPKETTGKRLMRDIMADNDMVKYRRLAKHLSSYPSEVLWAPLWKSWHWVWMRKNN